LEGYQYEAYGRQTVFAPGLNGVVDFGGDDVVMVGEVSLAGNPYLFTGRRFDGETGLYSYRSRYFNPIEGRFISRDTIGVWADPSSFGNGYAYAASNPVNNVDPLGKAVDMFIKIGDLKGEAQDKVHKDKIDVLAWSWGASQSGTMHTGGGGGGGKHCIKDLPLSKKSVDKAEKSPPKPRDGGGDTAKAKPTGKTARK
jgi:RHS repeat-associated protein